jgi:Uma2 family endonuclease
MFLLITAGGGNVALVQKKPEIYHEDRKWEMIDGIITFMSPGNVRHSETNIRIFRILDRHLRGSGCKVFMENIMVTLTKDDRFIPDIAVICDKKILRKDGAHGAPDLIVEVLSRSTAANDRGRKKNIYGKTGVKEYWIVDPDSYTVEIYINECGVMELDAVYAVYPWWEIANLTEDEKAEKLVYEFSPSMFDDLTINIFEIFEDILPEDY